MATYPDALTVGEARARYFAANGFGDGGYDARWVKLQAGPIPLRFPNTAARVAAVRLHDIHHVVTGYETTWTGEAEIGAWEIGSGCARHWAAWVLNLQALAIGLFIAAEAVFRAYVRGRRSANLYAGQFDEALLAPSVGALRRQLGLDGPVRATTAADRVGFAAWALASVVTLLVTVVVSVLPMAAMVAVAARVARSW